MDLALLEDGFIVMIIGMGTVFVFLSIMIFAMHLNGKVLQVLNKFFPEKIADLHHLPEKRFPARASFQR